MMTSLRVLHRAISSSHVGLVGSYERFGLIRFLHGAG